ncbi:MAG: thermonuclease family protein, partial [Hyphomicrobiaceae bacterium]
MRLRVLVSLMVVGVVSGTTAQACPMIGEVTAALGGVTAVGSATGTVARVVDGETLALSDGRQIRLEGALVPRALDVGAVAGTWPAELAVTAWLSPLVIGKSVVIVSAATRGAPGDGEARRLRHVVAQVAVEEEDGRRWWLQGAMVEQGHARVYRGGIGVPCLEALLSLEATARAQRTGLWALGAYRVIDLAVEPLIDGHGTTFQIVRGRVRSVFRTRSGVMLRMERGRGG